MVEQSRSKPTLIVIVGPTGSGKTDLSVTIANHFQTVIVSADSRQLYEGLTIGTAQPSKEQLNSVAHHFIATHNIKEHYTAGRYEKEALALLNELFVSHPIVVMVGGSGLYIDAVCDGMDNLPKSDPELRRSLNERVKNEGLDSLLSELKELDPVYYDIVDRNNPNRIIRALEVCLHSGRAYSEFRSGAKAQREFNVIKIATELPRDTLYERINRRVDIMISDGLIDEARKFYPHRHLNSLQTVGYRELFLYFDGDISEFEAIELIKRNSRRYAKRQITWFGKDEQVKWFDPASIDMIINHIESQLE